MATLASRKPIPGQSTPITARTAKAEPDGRLLMTIAVAATLLIATAFHALLALAP